MSGSVSQMPQAGYPQQQIGLSPEAKSTLLTASMAGVMGSTFFAPLKVGGVDNLLNLEADKFEKATKKVAKLADTTTEKQAFNILQEMRNAISDETVSQTNRIFGANNTIEVKDLFSNISSNIKTTEKADAYAKLLQRNIDKIKNGTGLLILPAVAENGVTEETYVKLEKIIPNSFKSPLKQFKEDFKAKFPIGSKPTQESIKEFLETQISPYVSKNAELSVLRRVANCANENGVINKADATKALKRFNTDCLLDQAKECFDAIKGKLPKCRIKSGVKWFGIGIAISILSNIVSAMILSNVKKEK